KIGLIIAVTVEMGIDIVAPGFIVGVADPADWGSICIQRDGGHEGAGDNRRLKAARRLQARRKWRGAVAGEDVVSSVCEVDCKSSAEQQLTGIGIDQEMKSFSTALTDDAHEPAQSHLRAAHREPDQLDTAFVEPGPGMESLSLISAGRLVV